MQNDLVSKGAGSDPYHDRKPIHYASLVNPQGDVSALCFPRPKAIRISKESWTIRKEAVTCKRCVELLTVVLLMALRFPLVVIIGRGKMTFCEAIQAMSEGKRVQRPNWKKLTCLFMQDGKIYSECKGEAYYFGQIAQQLVTATDWQLMNEAILRLTPAIVGKKGPEPRTQNQ